MAGWLKNDLIYSHIKVTIPAGTFIEFKRLDGYGDFMQITGPDEYAENELCFILEFTELTPIEWLKIKG